MSTQSARRQDRAEKVRAACAERGIRIEERGSAFRICGRGIDFTVSALSIVNVDRDLVAPPTVVEQ